MASEVRFLVDHSIGAEGDSFTLVVVKHRGTIHHIIEMNNKRIG